MSGKKAGFCHHIPQDSLLKKIRPPYQVTRDISRRVRGFGKGMGFWDSGFKAPW